MSKEKQIYDYLVQLQQRICDALCTYEPTSRFLVDDWRKENNFGGRTCILQGGEVFEKAGVNISNVAGDKLPQSASANRQDIANKAFQAMGISLVIHPKNPYVPTTHANVRFFTTRDDKPVWWFGGGFDLTPYYGFEEDCVHWHQVAKAACDPFGEDVYGQYKHWCDEYFHIKHRQEQRGIGGLFFDDLNEWGFERSFAFMQSVGDNFLKAYTPIVERRMHMPYGQAEVDFQHYRRGRYVEYNLVYDRGTLFGLQSGGRVESILMSLPKHVSWEYQHQAAPNSPEAALTDYYLKPKDWLVVDTSLTN